MIRDAIAGSPPFFSGNIYDTVGPYALADDSIITSLVYSGLIGVHSSKKDSC